MLVSQANAKKELNWLSFLFTLSIWPNPIELAQSISIMLALCNFMPFWYSLSLSSVMPFPFALCFTSLKWLQTINYYVVRVTEGWNAHLARNTCSPHHSYPPSVPRKCPERHPSPTLGSATTLRFPLAVIFTARSCLLEGGLGNRVSWKLSRVSYAISCESLFSTRKQVASRTCLTTDHKPQALRLNT